MSDSNTPHVTRRQHITREEEADRCLNHTVFSPGSQLLTVFLFLVIVFGVPITQHVVEIRQNIAKRAKWLPSDGVPKPGLAPQIYDVFGLLPTGDQIRNAKGFWGYWGLIPSVESINAFESSLKENSVLTTTLLSPTQLVMSTYLGAGNEKAYIGKSHWLFYRPDVEYLTTPGFLDPSRLKERSHGSTEVQPDPVKAMSDFSDQLAKRGIQLVVVPVPTKPMIHPEMLVGAPAVGISPLQNDSFETFKSLLAERNIRLFDPTQTLLDLKLQSPEKLYLQTDTHWTPGAMREVAIKLGDYLEKQCGLSRSTQEGLSLQQTKVSALGDIAEMLKLPSSQKLFAKQDVLIQQVLGIDGTPLQPDRNGDVLLLGDSFSNIYSLEGMGWGTGAGFAEQLSWALGRPIDKIVINAGGAYASRRDLARQMARGVDRLAHKKVVVYEFSMRDLAQGDWKMITLPIVKAKPTTRSMPTPIVKTKPVVPLSQFSEFKVEPLTLDISKPSKFTISVKSPAATLMIHVLDGKGKFVRDLGKIATNDPTPEILTTKWEGFENVPVGTYTIRIEGKRPDGTKMEPLSQQVILFKGQLNKSVTIPVSPTQPTKVVTPNKVPDKTPISPTKTTDNPAKSAEEGLIVTGRIASRPATPKPGSVPYKDCLIALQLTDLKVTGGTVKGPNIVVYVWGMRDNKLVDASYSVGQTIRFKLVPWASVDSKYGGYNRQELESDDALSWEAYWGEIK